MEFGGKRKVVVVGGVVIGIIIVIIVISLRAGGLSEMRKSSEPNPEIVPSGDPLYEKVLHSKTTDNYPPNDYFPKNLNPLNNDNFDISALAYAVMDRDSGELLYAKNLTTELSIASLTKIMSAVVTLENSSLTDIFTAAPSVVKVGEASMYLDVGERLTVEELLYGLMLPSGNDAAETLAEGVGIEYQKKNNFDLDRKSARDWFIAEMNRKAKSLGMMDTFFFNPTGLDGETKEQSSFSTALDLLALTNYALTNPTFAKIVQTPYISFPEKKGFHKGFYLENLLQLSRSFEGIKGVKPGTSIFARETLSSYIERDGKRIIVIILGSDFTKDDVVKIYKRIFREK